MYSMFDLRSRRLFGGWIVGITAFLLTPASFAQISAGGTPLSFQIPLKAAVPTVTMPAVDHTAYLAEDEFAGKEAPLRIAAQLDVALNLNNSGGWEDVPGGRAWRLRIVSAKAFSIALLYDQWHLPPGGTLFIYNDDHSHVLGAFTDFNNWKDGTNITGHVAGDAVTLEYFEPVNAAGEGVLSIYQVVHAYRNLFGIRDRETLDDFGGSGSCNVNVVCTAATEWQNQRRGVGLIIENGSRICSGSLINNTAQNQTPYFLTANHCYGGSASSWIFMFNYWSSACSPSVDGPTNQTVANATLRARSSTSDFCLMQLSSNVPTTYNSYFNGWNRIDSAATRSVCIHHPDCDVMKYSLDSNATVSDRYLGSSQNPANTHWKIVDWDIGTTEPGSSGAPLFDQNHRITGQLEGGYAACSNNSADWFGKFALSWTGGGSSTSRLSDWLDPLNTGVTTLDGFDPNLTGRIAGVVTDQYSNVLSGVRVAVLTTTQETATDAGGNYSLPVSAGTYSLEFTKYGYNHALITNVAAAAHDTTWLNVSLTTATMGILAGRVFTQTGIPLPSARIVISDTPLDTLTTDANGRFVVNLPATSYAVHLLYTIHTSLEEIASADTTVTLTGVDTTRVTLTLPLPRTNPTVEDQYGYRSYDRFDSGLPAVYEWVELNPELGGSGSEFYYPAADSAVYFAAPFPLKFYETSYDSLTVNENGWLLPGVHHTAGSTNTSIPSNTTADPAGIIAPYWDDLRSGLGNRQFAWYDAENGRWILQFSSQRLVSPANILCNWQVHILDPAFRPTWQGDCEFLFVYSRVDLATLCTVGIESPAENTGVRVLYNDSLNSNSMPIDSGAALRFTTGCATSLGNVTATLSFYPPAADPRLAVVHLAGRTITADANGLFIQDSIPSVFACGVVRLTGYESARRSNVWISANTMNNITFESWRLDPPTELSATQFNGAVTLRWRKPESVAYHSNAAVRYYVYRNGARVSGGLQDTVFTDVVLPDDFVARYQVMVRYSYDNTALSDSLHIEIDLNANDGGIALPTRYALHAAYPNPFNPTTTLRFDMPHAGRASVRLYNLNGQLVKTLVNDELTAGSHEVIWNADGQPSGTYLAVLEAGSQRFVQKLLLLK
jgi:hypothetical protein